MKNEITEYAFISKMSDMPMAKLINDVPMLFYKGHHWNINIILGEMAAFDTDVYAVLEFNNPILEELIEKLVREDKLSLSRLSFRQLREADVPTWTGKPEFRHRGDSIQEEFINWLVEDLKFEFFK